MTVSRRGRHRRGAFIQAKVAVNKNAEQTRKLIPIPQIPVTREKNVPMISRLPEQAENNRSKWPKTARYVPIGNNIAGAYLSEKVKEAIHEGMTCKNKICCECGPGVDCVTNPNCGCRKVAQSMADNFTKGQLLINGEPAPFNDTTGDFWRENFYNCSETCSCKGKCALNALQTIDKHRFVIRRENQKGFCLFSNHAIKKGTPVISFNGVMCGFNAITPEVEQYALMVIDCDKEMAKWLTKAPVISSDYAQLLKQSFLRMMWVNPLEQGNCARFLAHGCRPNVSMRRVFQGGLSPANIRIVMFAIEDISAGDELTFDYGERYKKKFLEGCLCQQCLTIRRTRKLRSSVSADTEGVKSRGNSEDNTASKPSKQGLRRISTRSGQREHGRQTQEPAIKEITTSSSMRSFNPRAVIKEEIVTDDEDDEEDDVVEPPAPVRRCAVVKISRVSRKSCQNTNTSSSRANSKNEGTVRVHMKERSKASSNDRKHKRDGSSRQEVPSRKIIKQESIERSQSRSPSPLETHSMALRMRQAPQLNRQRSGVRRSARLATSIPPTSPSPVRSSPCPQQILPQRKEEKCREPISVQRNYSPISLRVRRVTRKTDPSPNTQQTVRRRSERLRSVSQVDC